MLQKAARVFGVVFLLIGVLGFVPGITDEGHLMGIFHVDMLHNFVHIGSGLAALWASKVSGTASRRYFQIFGVTYALVTVLGFISMDKDILGVMANNMADNILHIVLASTSLYFGFKRSEVVEADA